jgi:hypothetical protein
VLTLRHKKICSIARKCDYADGVAIELFDSLHGSVLLHLLQRGRLFDQLELFQYVNELLYIVLDNLSRNAELPNNLIDDCRLTGTVAKKPKDS